MFYFIIIIIHLVELCESEVESTSRTILNIQEIEK